MLLMTSTTSPSIAAALFAKSWCSGCPAAASRNMKNTITPASADSPRAIGTLTIATRKIEAAVATQGGSTFQMNRFSKVKIALEAAVIRLLSVPGLRSEK